MRNIKILIRQNDLVFYRFSNSSYFLLIFYKTFLSANTARMFKSLSQKFHNTGYFSGLYFHVSGLNTGKYRPEKTPYLDTFHAVNTTLDE